LSAVDSTSADPLERTQVVFEWLANHVAHGRTRDPHTVLLQRRGDRTGLFVAMLRALDIPVQIVRARTGRAPVIAPSYPDTRDYPETLVRITTGDRTTWADMGRASPWLGQLPPQFQEGHYLTRSDEGAPVVRPFVDGDVAQWPVATALDLDVRRDGDASGTLRMTFPGTYGADLARLLSAARPEDRKRQMQRWLTSLMPSAQLQELDVLSRATSVAPLVVTASVAVPGFMSVDRDHLVLEDFFSRPMTGRFLGQPGLREYVSLPRRRLPLLISPTFEVSTVHVRFPPSVASPQEAPRTFVRTADFGRFEQSFEWDDKSKTARMERRRIMPLRRIAPEAFSAFRDNAQSVLQVSRNRLIVPLGAPIKTAAVMPAPICRAAP
ncbi:MAG: hypothetical protein AAF449_20930, partial [Myxococcota bacterium]